MAGVKQIVDSLTSEVSALIRHAYLEGVEAGITHVMFEADGVEVRSQALTLTYHREDVAKKKWLISKAKASLK